jgi:hypothetical protein
VDHFAGRWDSSGNSANESSAGPRSIRHARKVRMTMSTTQEMYSRLTLSTAAGVLSLVVVSPPTTLTDSIVEGVSTGVE